VDPNEKRRRRQIDAPHRDRFSHEPNQGDLVMKWEYREDFEGEESTGIRVWEGGAIVCTMPGIGQADTDNARLIAAAPDLLAALRAVFADVANADTDSSLSPHVGLKVRSAIAKATGEAA
jgi:hypothetical protein